MGTSQKLEAERKQREQSKRLDYLTRAMRMEEKDLLIKSQDEIIVKEKETFIADLEKFAEQHKANHEKAILEKTRLLRMKDNRDAFFSKIISERRAIYEEKKAAQDERLEAK